MTERKMPLTDAGLRERLRTLLVERMCTFLNWTDADFDAVVALVHDAARAEVHTQGHTGAQRQAACIAWR